MNQKNQESKTFYTLFQHIHNRSEALKQHPLIVKEETFQAFFTELKTYLEQMFQLFQKMQKFTAEVAHELRNPLTTIRGELEFLQQYPETFNVVELEVLVDEIQRLTSLCSRLLLLAKLEEEAFLLPKKNFSLSQFLEQFLEQIFPLADSRQIQVTLEIKDSINFYGNEDLLSQVFFNLLDNAIRYTEAGGKITLLLEKLPQWIHVQISDTGRGIAEEHLPYIFERFYRAPGNEEISGSGLGLAIVKEIVELHGGKIRVSSTFQKGTTFDLEFPLPKEDLLSN